jgi:hypothetical protein
VLLAAIEPSYRNSLPAATRSDTGLISDLIQCKDARSYGVQGLFPIIPWKRAGFLTKVKALPGFSHYYVIE